MMANTVKKVKAMADATGSSDVKFVMFLAISMDSFNDSVSRTLVVVAVVVVVDGKIVVAISKK